MEYMNQEEMRHVNNNMQRVGGGIFPAVLFGTTSTGDPLTVKDGGLHDPAINS